MKNLLRRIFPNHPKTDQPPITIVSGLPRSGTSLMMKMLEAGGIPALVDGIREADTHNPKGYYEYERVKKLDKGDVAWLSEAQGKVVKVISALLKFMPPDYAYRVIFMERTMDEILASQRKMLVQRRERGEANAGDISDEEMTALFQAHLHETKAWLVDQPNSSTLYVHYSELLADPTAQIARLNEFLGGDLDVQSMAEIVDPNLYRNRA